MERDEDGVVLGSTRLSGFLCQDFQSPKKSGFVELASKTGS
jgi:hypothetical protein